MHESNWSLNCCRRHNAAVRPSPCLIARSSLTETQSITITTSSVFPPLCYGRRTEVSWKPGPKRRLVLCVCKSNGIQFPSSMIQARPSKVGASGFVWDPIMLSFSDEMLVFQQAKQNSRIRPTTSVPLRSASGLLVSERNVFGSEAHDCGLCKTPFQCPYILQSNKSVRFLSFLHNVSFRFQRVISIHEVEALFQESIFRSIAINE